MLAAVALTALVVASLASGAPAATRAKKPPRPPVHYLFAGIPWLTPGDTAATILVARGYTAVPEAGTRNEITCGGRLYDHYARITGFLDDQRRLMRWVVAVAPDPQQEFVYPIMHKVYEDVVEEGANKYGPPPYAVHHFEFPFAPDDGRQDHALREGKATIRSEWVSKARERLIVEMDSTSSVILRYESPEWAAFEARRRAKKARDL